MNKDRAIQLLERMQNPEPYDPQITSEAFDAIQMAIDALSADGDTISRKAVLDALDEIETEVADGYGYQYAKWREYFAELPSVESEPDFDDVTCNDCRYSEKFVNGLILCRRTKTSHRGSATSTCGKGKRETEDAEAKV